MQAYAADAASLMRAFGNESRLMILCTLAEGERSVGELNEIIPLTGAPTTEIRGVHSPFLSDVFFPLRPWNVSQSWTMPRRKANHSTWLSATW